jgi:hypothetical protein
LGIKILAHDGVNSLDHRFTIALKPGLKTAIVKDLSCDNAGSLWVYFSEFVEFYDQLIFGIELKG